MSPTISLQTAFSSSLSIKDLKKATPSVFTEAPSDRVSEEYNHMPTDIVVKDLMKEGWQVHRAYEVKVKKDANKGFQKHFLYFRHPKLWIGSEDSVEMYPEMLLTNSHDGRAAFNFFCNLFRVVCSNSMVMATHDFGHISVKHRSYTFRELREISKQMIGNTQLIVEKIDAMRNRKLSTEEIKKLAIEACQARWDYLYRPNVNELLTRVRQEDEGADLWTLYNVLQEKMIKGGWQGAGGRKIKTIVDHNREVNINRKLFTIVQNYL